jgi:hypothetical protein
MESKAFLSHGHRTEQIEHWRDWRWHNKPMVHAIRLFHWQPSGPGYGETYVSLQSRCVGTSYPIFVRHHPSMADLIQDLFERMTGKCEGHSPDGVEIDVAALLWGMDNSRAMEYFTAIVNASSKDSRDRQLVLTPSGHSEFDREVAEPIGPDLGLGHCDQCGVANVRCPYCGVQTCREPCPLCGRGLASIRNPA